MLIKEGANTFMIREYKILAIFAELLRLDLPAASLPHLAGLFHS